MALLGFQGRSPNPAVPKFLAIVSTLGFVPKQSINHSTAVFLNLAWDRNELIQECPKLHFQNLITLGFVLRPVSIVDRQ
jgi:hypothetical protein